MCGSFKVRGALNKMFSLSLEEREKGVVTASSGNHAQGIAMAAKALGVRAVICVPGVCPQTKREAILMLGGQSVELSVVGHLYDDAEDEAHRLQKEEGMTYVSSYEDHFIVSGAGTLGLELIMDEPELDMVISPAGGGGLLNGIAIPVKAARPEAEIWGVQSVASNPYVVSWPGGKVLDVEYKDSLADGLTGSIPQSLLNLAKKRVTGFVEVQESDIAQAIGFLHSKHHQVVEGAGAIGVAAIMSGKIPVKGKRVGVVISGGNIDDGRLLQILNDYRD
jgi:threonine dehydratase